MANPRNKWLIGSVAAVTIAGAALWEGKRNVPYIPIPGDVWTVCYGETKVQMRRYSDAECATMLKHSLVKYSDGVLQCINVPVNANEHSAYTLFAYNVGVPAFCRSNLLRKLNRGDHAGACKGLATADSGKPAWSYAQGKYVQGLQNRRRYERNLCLKPAPAAPNDDRGIA